LLFNQTNVYLKKETELSYLRHVFLSNVTCTRERSGSYETIATFMCHVCSDFINKTAAMLRNQLHSLCLTAVFRVFFFFFTQLNKNELYFSYCTFI